MHMKFTYFLNFKTDSSESTKTRHSRQKFKKDSSLWEGKPPPHAPLPSVPAAFLESKSAYATANQYKQFDEKPADMHL